LDSHSLEFSDVVLHQTALLQLNIIQTITTEGSMFDSVIDEHGFFNTQLIDLQYLQNLFGPYVGLIEVKSESNDWFIVGIATGHYRKSCLVGTKKVFCGLLFLPEFRGYGFGELLALIGMTLLEINDKMDIVYEDATIRNEITAKLIKRVGFESYGLVSKQEYDITCRDCVGIYRTFRYSSKILQNQLLTEKDDRKKKILLQRIQLNESLKRTIKCLIRKNILNNIIY